jgi:cytochrome c1
VRAPSWVARRSGTTAAAAATRSRGVRSANGLVGPPLIKFSKRGYIAGELKNNADNLQRWLEDPKAVEPGTDMPNLHVTPDDARNITAYLYTLK